MLYTIGSWPDFGATIEQRVNTTSSDFEIVKNLPGLDLELRHVNSQVVDSWHFNEYRLDRYFVPWRTRSVCAQLENMQEDIKSVEVELVKKPKIESLYWF